MRSPARSPVRVRGQRRNSSIVACSRCGSDSDAARPQSSKVSGTPAIAPESVRELGLFRDKLGVERLHIRFGGADPAFARILPSHAANSRMQRMWSFLAIPSTARVGDRDRDPRSANTSFKSATGARLAVIDDGARPVEDYTWSFIAPIASRRDPPGKHQESFCCVLLRTGLARLVFLFITSG